MRLITQLNAVVLVIYCVRMGPNLLLQKPNCTILFLRFWWICFGSGSQKYRKFLVLNNRQQTRYFRVLCSFGSSVPVVSLAPAHLLLMIDLPPHSVIRFSRDLLMTYSFQSGVLKRTFKMEANKDQEVLSQVLVRCCFSVLLPVLWLEQDVM